MKSGTAMPTRDGQWSHAGPSQQRQQQHPRPHSPALLLSAPLSSMPALLTASGGPSSSSSASSAWSSAASLPCLAADSKPPTSLMPISSSSSASSHSRKPTRGPWRIETSATTSASTPSHEAMPSGSSAYSSPPSSQSSPPLTPPDSTERVLTADLDKKSLSQQQGRSSNHILKSLLPPISPHSSTAPSTITAPSSPSIETLELHRPATGKSRNDIFGSTPSTPCKPPPSSTAMSRYSTNGDNSSAAAASPVHCSRNSLFFDTPSSSPSFSIRRSEWQPNGSNATSAREEEKLTEIKDRSGVSPDVFTTPDNDEMTRRPSLGRSSTVERERERVRIRQSKETDFRLAPCPEYLLGQGRHCDVFLGAWRRRYITSSSQAQGSSDWQLCAVKRLHPDRQAQLLGLDEAFALRRLGPHPGLVKLIDIRDEVSAATCPMPTPTMDQTSLETSRLSPTATASDCDEQMTASIDTIQGDSGHQKVDGDTLTPSRLLPTPSASTNPTATPRLLILLELLPLNLATYSQKHACQIDLFFWLQCACELAATLEWMHGKGCVHCDIKPENILLDHNLRTKLCDFNSAFFPNASSSPLTDGLGLGTPAYGAPELTKRSKSGDVVSLPVDIFSLGALLYSLATGVEPMARSKSMIEMLHRKERFFLTEENDRIARISVAEGLGDSSSNAGSANPSRHSSLRRANRSSASTSLSKRASMGHRASRRRDSSADSAASTRSNITTKNGKTPSLAAIQLLLGPSSWTGVLLPASVAGLPDTPADASGSGHHRALSLHKNYAPAASCSTQSASGPDAAGSKNTADPASHNAPVPPRPTAVRRTISHGGGIVDCGDKAMHLSENVRLDKEGQDSLSLSLAVSASFADVSREKYRMEETAILQTAEGVPLHTCNAINADQSKLKSGHFNADAATQSQQEEDEDRSPYRDGSPALLLPGGGKLPQAALDLLEEMLQANPSRRPKASETRRRLEAIREETIRALR